MKKKIVSIIIPGYNESHRVESTINSVECIMDSLGRQYEILVVDDGSTDDTVAALEGMVSGKKHRRLRFVSYADGPSRRENLAKSFRLLKGDYVMLLDMDLSMDPAYIKDMIQWIEQGYDLVLGSRYHKDSKVKRHPTRFLVSKLYNATIRVLFNTGFKDNICGFKAFRKDAILRLVGEAGIDKTGRRGVFWDTEIVIRAIWDKLKIKEIPISWKEAKSSSLTFRREIKMVPYILKFWIRNVLKI